VLGSLVVLLLPLDDQRRYGEAFRRIRQLRPAAHHAAEPAFRSADILTGGLTAGTLKPPEGPGKAAG
jgi:hypothetical protein